MFHVVHLLVKGDEGRFMEMEGKNGTERRNFFDRSYPGETNQDSDCVVHKSWHFS